MNVNAESAGQAGLACPRWPQMNCGLGCRVGSNKIGRKSEKRINREISIAISIN